MSDLNHPHYLPPDDSDVTHNPDYHRQDHGGLVTTHNGVADRLLVNNDLYRAMKGDWKRSSWSRNRNIKTTTGREGGRFFIQREQMNIDQIRQECRDYRARAEQGWADPLAPIMPDGKLGYKWINLPKVISVEISDRYFGGMPWPVIKQDRTLKAQFYRVVQQEYPDFVCYPGGRLPIPVDVPYPRAAGQQRFFQGN